MLLAEPLMVGIEQQCCCNEHIQQITVAVVVAGVAFALGRPTGCWSLSSWAKEMRDFRRSMRALVWAPQQVLESEGAW